MLRQQIVATTALATVLVGLVFIPDSGSAQTLVYDCGKVCTSEGCPEGMWQGIGQAIGIFDKDCSQGDCLVPCEPDPDEEEPTSLARTTLQSILMDLKSATSQADLRNLAVAYRQFLILDAQDDMVLGLGGCDPQNRQPVSMVRVTPQQMATLQGLEIPDLEDRFFP